MITVAQLIAHLQTLPGDARVVVEGYEYGFADIEPPRAVILQIDAHDLIGINGAHAIEGETRDAGPDDDWSGTTAPGVLIGRIE